MVVQPSAPQILAPTPPAPSVRVNPKTKSRSASLPKTQDASTATSTTALHSLHYIIAALATTIAVVCVLDTQRKPSHIRMMGPAYLMQLHIEINALRHAQAKVAEVQAAIIEAQTPVQP